MRPLLLPLGLTALLCLLPALAPADNSVPQLPAPEGAQVYFITPQDGASVGQTFTVRFGLKVMGVAPAGVDVPATGHHHLLVDVATLPLLDAPLPATEQILHFGKGQTETELTLPPGKHTLQLLIGDKHHVPMEPPVISEKISITVQ
ncbi:DUF4399 domain-containing protein [Aquipseudomonas alcaligenes]|uniref:DUF4399 domain-containing protein n=1 Tax=Aquipseudomonas alcaligenes TaxID=43263 RepID=A0AA37CEX2_AQUAC|nr:DUF4399 domain-containing protein [Pseudomonas alcaligenes]BCR26728.1 hypothetical protein KAM426_42550 [Pseudomonas alcaligenes]GIZ65676.1 hypothetical protein KAM428_07610 [Pseudomonas alcaligenes]GIZ70010.1 hypothetical protein KAM429_07710 [Pseudomonas alcaligenes]GIZ74363.1 hypothetical protein KAM430_07720 [Pseudomonas alcaligenes]GIZ78691.1 hypothetical protein KAM432_07390 [Pseudomonas alcaligenes]